MIKLYIQTVEPDLYIESLNDIAGKPFEFTIDKNDYDYVYGLNIMTKQKVREMCWERLSSLTKEELWDALNMFCSNDDSISTFSLNLIIYSNCKKYKFLYDFILDKQHYYSNVVDLIQHACKFYNYIDYNWTEIEWLYFKYLWNKCDFKTLN